MRKAKRLALRALQAEQARCAAKFDALDNAMVEYGHRTVSKMRDKMNACGIHWDKPTGFNQKTRATEKRRGCSQIPRGL
jgi:hypothetical protein